MDTLLTHKLGEYNGMYRSNWRERNISGDFYEGGGLLIIRTN